MTTIYLCGIPACLNRDENPNMLFCLAPDGVCPAGPLLNQRVSSYLTFSPLPISKNRRLFSAALSMGLLPPGLICSFQASYSSGVRTFLPPDKPMSDCLDHLWDNSFSNISSIRLTEMVSKEKWWLNPTCSTYCFITSSLAVSTEPRKI